jgi:hypothetical protein
VSFIPPARLCSVNPPVHERFHVLTAANMNIRAFWNVEPCSLAIALMMEAVRTSETSVCSNQTNGATSQKALIFTPVLEFKCAQEGHKSPLTL